jgi:phenylpropionate dioxygenase-like ring-hydroxylating dioxygenase large terminal subunit
VFIHQSQLRHVLRPARYYDEGLWREEVDRLFVPAWHCVATRADLPRDGDYLTLDLLGQPVLVRNAGGELHAYLNVCAHRHCLLTSRRRGCDPRFRCQYHGWEYDREGRTGRIPDARCFRPFDRENARLRKFRLEMCGELAFVCLADDGPGLAEFLGPYHATARAEFAPPYRQVWTWETTYEANWKIPIENSLESYHIPCLHAATFGNMPPEERCEHDLGERHTTFRTRGFDSRRAAVARWMVRRLGVEPRGFYVHHHAHPHLTFASTDVSHLVQIMLPVAPTRTRHLAWLYTPYGVRKGVGNWLLARALRRAVIRVARRVMSEDVPIFAEVQRGLRASPHPGVIGTREERLFVFQQYVARACGDPAAGTEAVAGEADHAATPAAATPVRLPDAR